MQQIGILKEVMIKGFGSISAENAGKFTTKLFGETGHIGLLIRQVICN
jgi:hypothetical protein